MAAFIWWTLVGWLGVVTVWSLLADLYLDALNEGTITAYLRAHPWAFWLPVTMLTAAIMILAAHLYFPGKMNGIQ